MTHYDVIERAARLLHALQWMGDQEDADAAWDRYPITSATRSDYLRTAEALAAAGLLTPSGATRHTRARSGNRSTAATSGNRSTAATSGYESTAATSGNRSTAATSGNRSIAATSGNRSMAKVEGEHSIAVAGGYQCRAMGSLGCWLVLAERDYHGAITHLEPVQVDGERIKPDVAYMLLNGKVVKA